MRGGVPYALSDGNFKAIGVHWEVTGLVVAGVQGRVGGPADPRDGTGSKFLDILDCEWMGVSSGGALVGSCRVTCCGSCWIRVSQSAVPEHSHRNALVRDWFSFLRELIFCLRSMTICISVDITGGMIAANYVVWQVSECSIG